MQQRHARENPPKVSVCCAWYNRSDAIRGTIDSLLGQRFDSFEIVVVNDGSRDPRVREILSAYSDPRLVVVEQDNAGFVNAIRRAIDESRGEYIAIQGAGDVSYPDRLRRQAGLLDSEPDVGVVGCRCDGVVIGGPGDGFREPGRLLTKEPTIDHFLRPPNPLGHGEVMMRRRSYDAVGGYRPFFKFAQDLDLWIRMARVCQFRILEETLYERRTFHDDGIAADRSKLLLQHKLANFARQCHRDRVENGRDYVDVYGQYAGLFGRPSSAFADFASRQSLQAFAVGDHDSAAFFCRVALRERKTPYALFAAACIAIANRSRFSANLVRSWLLKHPNARRWGSTRGIGADR
jgi:glycosyltransferase involved in cell wall biosynthesis